MPIKLIFLFISLFTLLTSAPIADAGEDFNACRVCWDENSSIFDVKVKKNFYDIVHCRGVLSHTSGKEIAFKKIASSLKKGGILIFGAVSARLPLALKR